MNHYCSRFLLCLVFVLPSWLTGALQNMANGSDLLVTAGFAAVLAWALGLRTAPAETRLRQQVISDSRA